MDLAQSSIDILFKLHAFMKSNPDSGHLEASLQRELSQIATKISSQKTTEKQQLKQQRAYPDYLKQSVLLVKKQTVQEVRHYSDYFNHLVKEVFSVICFEECFCGFFDLKELLKLRLVSSNFNSAIQMHFLKRVPQEEALLAKMIFSSVLADLSSLKMFLFNQIPPHARQWIEWDQNSCKQKITSLLSKQDYESLKQMRSIPKHFDLVFAPMALLFSSKEKHHSQSYFQYFKETFTPITLNKIEQTLRKNQLVEASVLQCAAKLSELRRSESEVLRFSRACHSMIGWCQFVVSLYFLENIFVVRRLDKEQSIEYDFNHMATVTQFFRAQHLIINACKSITKNEQRFIIYLDFQSLNFINTQQPQESVPFFIQENIPLVSNIWNFLSFKEIVELRLVSHYFKTISEGYFVLNILVRYFQEKLISLIYQFELIKLKSNQLKPKFPMLYELGFFSPMLDLCYTILMEQQRPLVQHNQFEILKSAAKNNPNNEFIKQICSAFCHLFQPSSPNPEQSVRSLIAQTKVQKIVNQNSNPFSKSIDQILFAELNLEKLCMLVAQNPKQNYNLQAMHGLFCYMKLFIMIFKALNPLLFIRQAHFENKFTEEEQAILIQLNEVFVMCLTFLKTLNHFGLLSPHMLRTCLTTALERFTLDEKQLIANQLNQKFFLIYSQYHQETITYDNSLNFLTEIIKLYEESMMQYETKVSTKINISQQSTIDLLQNSKVFIMKILPFLSIQELLQFSTACRAANNIYKMHLISRIYSEGNSLKQLELLYKTHIHNIMKKRGNQVASKEKAFNLMSQISHKDIANLKTISHPNQWHEIFAQPFTLVFDLAVQKNNYWQTLQKNFLCHQDAYKRLSEFETETMPQHKVIQLYGLLNDPRFSIQQCERMNQSLYKLVQWLQGVLQMHQLLRRYCLNNNDQDNNLNDDEISYLNYIDKRQLTAYKAVRFINKFQQTDSHFNEYSKWFQNLD